MKMPMNSSIILSLQYCQESSDSLKRLKNMEVKIPHHTIRRRNMFQVSQIKKSKLMWCMEAKGHGVNGWRGVQRRQSFIRWIILMFKDDVPYITSPCRKLHETWDGGGRVGFIPWSTEQTPLFGYNFAKVMLL